MAATVIVLSIAATVAVVWQGASTPSAEASIFGFEGLTSQARSAADSVLARGLAILREQTGITFRNPSDPSAPESAGSAGAPASQPDGAAPAAPRPGSSAAVRRPDVRPVPTAAPAARPSAAVVRAPSPAPAPNPVAPVGPPNVSARPAAAAAPVAVPAADLAQIYSSADPDVVPPELQYPQLPAQLLPGRADMNTIELIISETGKVERVRLLSPPKRMADMMLLSGAKTWGFEPASKDGQSVRYRLQLSWAATP